MYVVLTSHGEARAFHSIKMEHAISFSGNLFKHEGFPPLSLGVPRKVELKGSLKEASALLEEEMWMEGGQDEPSQHLTLLQQRCSTAKVSERSPDCLFL